MDSLTGLTALVHLVAVVINHGVDVMTGDGFGLAIVTPPCYVPPFSTVSGIGGFILS